MKFVENVRADVTADIVYMMCPMHLLKLDEMISDLEVGQVLEVLTDYDGALEDIPQWCRRTGNEFIGMNETEDFYKFYIRKTAKRDLTGSPSFEIRKAYE
jgi:tRNA 2-thiouridine synthesizing protein A